MKVAVVVAYNSKVEMTVEFLDTMQRFWPAASTGIEPRLILVNGGCPTKIEHPFTSLRIDLPENGGFCRVLNAGLQSVPVSADYVFFVGNDSFPIDSLWLPRLIELHERTGAWMTCPANDRPGMSVLHRFCHTDCHDYWEVDFFPSIAWLMARRRMRKVGLLDERYVRTGMYADNDYCRRIRQSNGKIVVSKEILLRHLLSAEGQALGTAGEDMAINCKLYIEKWGGLLPVEL